MPVELEGYIRPGCTILTVFIAMPQSMWDKVWSFAFSNLICLVMSYLLFSFCHNECIILVTDADCFCSKYITDMKIVGYRMFFLYFWASGYHRNYCSLLISDEFAFLLAKMQCPVWVLCTFYGSHSILAELSCISNFMKKTNFFFSAEDYLTNVFMHIHREKCTISLHLVVTWYKIIVDGLLYHLLY